VGEPGRAERLEEGGVETLGISHDQASQQGGSSRVERAGHRLEMVAGARGQRVRAGRRGCQVKLGGIQGRLRSDASAGTLEEIGPQGEEPSAPRQARTRHSHSPVEDGHARIDDRAPPTTVDRSKFGEGAEAPGPLEHPS
jgi:hypothetical protein